MEVLAGPKHSCWLSHPKQPAAGVRMRSWALMASCGQLPDGSSQGFSKGGRGAGVVHGAACRHVGVQKGLQRLHSTIDHKNQSTGRLKLVLGVSQDLLGPVSPWLPVLAQSSHLRCTVRCSMSSAWWAHSVHPILTWSVGWADGALWIIPSVPGRHRADYLGFCKITHMPMHAQARIWCEVLSVQSS